MESVISTREEVQNFLSIPNHILAFYYGSGSGSGSSFGYGHGSGKGSGDGYSKCSGSGRGDGSGYGDGFDYGYGYGYCTGYGSADAEGFSYCAGSGDIISLNYNIVDYVDNVPTIITQVRGNIACGYIVEDNLILSPCYIAKSGNSFAHGDTIKEAVTDAKAKELDNMPIKERIEKFVKTFGPLDSEHTGKEFYDWHHILTGSCSFGRNSFCKTHDIDLTKKYTVRYFLEITKDSYGSDVIKLIREEYKI